MEEKEQPFFLFQPSMYMKICLYWNAVRRFLDNADARVL